MRGSMYIISLVAVGSLALAQTAKAQSTGGSDRMVISAPTGGPIFDNSIPEIAPPGEPPLIFGGGPIPAPVTAPPVVVATSPGTSVLFLVEPAGALPEPGEMPLFIPGTNTLISDAVVSSGQSTQFPPQIIFVSDGGNDLQQLVTAIPNFPQPPRILPETGTLQDVTALLAPTPFGPIGVSVQSDLVPEPATFSLLGIGAFGLLARRRRA